MKTVHPNLLGINLSRDPFRNRRLFWFSWSLGLICLLFLAKVTWNNLSETQNRIRQSQDRNAKKEKELADLRNSQTLKSPPLLTPEQDKSMRSVLFLLDQRNFSWSRLLTQLELETPREIRIAQIAFKQSTDQEEVSFNPSAFPFSLTVRALKPEHVTAFMREMDRHGVFHFEMKKQGSVQENLQGGGSSGELEFTLEGTYNPNAPDLKTPVVLAQKNDNAKDDDDESPAPKPTRANQGTQKVKQKAPYRRN